MRRYRLRLTLKETQKSKKAKEIAKLRLNSSHKFADKVPVKVFFEKLRKMMRQLAVENKALKIEKEARQALQPIKKSY